MQRIGRHRREIEKYEGYLSQCSLAQLRELFGQALKYFLPKEHWDHAAPIPLMRSPTEPLSGPLANHPNIVPMMSGFCAVRRGHLEQPHGKSPVCDCMRALVAYRRGLDTHQCPVRRRKKRLNRFRKDFRKRLNRRGQPGSHEGKGITVFASSVRHQFLV